MRLDTVPHRTTRRHERLAVVSPATLFTDPEAGEMVGRASYTLDISERGARLRTSAIALSIGQTVVILPHGEAPRRAVRGRVVKRLDSQAIPSKKYAGVTRGLSRRAGCARVPDGKGKHSAKFA